MKHSSSKFKIVAVSALLLAGLSSTSAMAYGWHGGYRGGWHGGWGWGGGGFLAGAIVGTAIGSTWNSPYYYAPAPVVYSPPVYVNPPVVYSTPVYTPPVTTVYTAPVQRTRTTVEVLDANGNVVRRTTTYGN
jgi:hypothetical protein